MKSWKKLSTGQKLEKVETSYLFALRVAGLLAATACLLVALFLSGDALWRFAVNTKVKPEPTSINSIELARLVSAPTVEQSNQSSASGPNPYKVAHDAFKTKFWPSYYEIYRKAAQQYTNAQAPLVSSETLMAHMGYDLDSYKNASLSDDMVMSAPVTRLVNDTAYQQAALKHVGEVFASNAVKNRLNAFTRSTKSEERCTTTPTTQRVNRVCGYYYVYDCSYTRTIQNRRCEKVFPDNVLSPAAAFEKADLIFADRWLGDEHAKRVAANAKSAQRQLLRDGILPRFHLALMIIGGFLIIMFFFLLIAIERHLRPARTEPEALPPKVLPVEGTKPDDKTDWL